MRAKPALGYRSLTDAACALADEGRDNAAIAEALKVTPQRASGLLSVGKRAVKRRLAPIPLRIMDRLAAAARARQATPTELASRILEAVVDDDMIDAVLDDGAGPA